MTTTPKLGLTMMAANMAQKEVVFNEMALAFDALFSGSVLSASLATPPGSPSLGDTYIIAASPTDAWSGKADYIAFWYNGWQFFSPVLQLRLYDVETESFIRYLGPSLHWVASISEGGPSYFGIRTVTTSYTLISGDVDYIILANFSSAGTITIPPHSSVPFATTTAIMIEQIGSGGVTIVAGSGVTLNSVGGGLVIAGQYAFAKLTNTAVDVWQVELSNVAAGGTLSGLSDVEVTEGSGIDGQFLAWRNSDSKWEAKVPALAGLSDVELSDPPAGTPIITYNSGMAKWVYGSLPTNASFMLASLGDVSLTEGSGVDGYVLYWNNTDSKFELKPPALGADGPSLLGINTQTASYTLVLTDVGKLVDMNVGTANNLTVPPNSSVALPIDSVITVRQRGAGSTTIVAGSGVTLNALSGILEIVGQYGLATLTKVATDTWEVSISGLATVGGATTLTALTDVTVSEGSGIDKEVLYWHNAASAWESITLSALIDTALGNTQGDVLYRGSASWGVLAPGTSGQVLTTGGASANPSWTTVSGGGSALLPPYYENGPFAPPDPSWFDFSGSYTTTTGTTIANQGMLISAATGTNNDNYCFGRRSTSAWGSSWTVTVRLRMGNAAIRNYPGMAVVVEDSSGKMVSWTWISQGTLNIPVIQLLKLSNNHSYNSSYFSAGSTTPPEMMRVSYDGTHLTFGASWDGGNTWENYQVSATDWLSSPAYVGIGGDNFITSGNTTPAQFGVLCTYYDDPDYPASGHETLTPATLGDLADVSVTSPSNRQVLTYDSGSGDWKNAPPVYGEIGPFAPPQSSWFSNSSATGVTVTLTNTASVGMQIQGSGFSSIGQLMTTTRPTTDWGVTWAMTARVVPHKLLGLQFSFGICVKDSSGKIRYMGLSANGSDLELVFQVWNDVNTYSSQTTIYMSDTPRWMRVRLSGGNLYFGLSWDGQVWLENSELLTANLADASYVGFAGNQFPYDSDPWSAPYAGTGALITYYDDPDYPASAHYGN